MQHKYSLGSTRSMSGMLPCLTVVRVAPPASEALVASGASGTAGTAAATCNGGSAASSGEVDGGLSNAAEPYKGAASGNAAAAGPATAGTGNVREADVGGAAAAEPQLLAQYTKPLLKAMLQLMGCKPRHAHKVSVRLSRTVSAERLVPSAAASKYLASRLQQYNESLPGFAPRLHNRRDCRMCRFAHDRHGAIYR